MCLTHPFNFREPLLTKLSGKSVGLITSSPFFTNEFFSELLYITNSKSYHQYKF